MSQRRAILAEILGFDGWRVVEAFHENAEGRRVMPLGGYGVFRGTKLVLVVARLWLPRCSGCGAACRIIHERCPTRRWRDLPWAERNVEIEFAPSRVKCRACDATPVEMVAWAEPRQTLSRRLQQQLTIEAASAPLSRVAARYGLSWSTVRRAEMHAIERWEATRPLKPLRQVGVDEKWLGRRHRLDHKFVTIVSDLDTGEPIWFGKGRSEETLAQWLGTLTAEQKHGIDVFAMDMHRPFYNAVTNTPGLAHAAIVHDGFHIMKRAGEAIDEVRRAVFFRAGAEMRRVGHGGRWLLLRAWERCTESQQADVRALLALNGKLARAYQLKELLRFLVVKAPDGQAMAIGLGKIIRRARRSSLDAMRRLGDSLDEHFAAIVDLAEYRPPAGRIEALNNNWEALVRRARGYRNHDYLFRKLRFTIANPLRTLDGLRQFADLGAPQAMAA